MKETYFQVYENDELKATGFQFKEDAEWWIEQYKKHHKNCGDLYIKQIN